MHILAGPITLNGKQPNETTAPKTAFRADPKLETILARSASKLLEQRISEYHPERDFTLACLGEMRFRDRPMSDREKLTVLAICRCYDQTRRQFTLSSYLGYLKNTHSDDVDLVGMLINYRENPSVVMDVNKYAVGELGRLLRKIRRIKNND